MAQILRVLAGLTILFHVAAARWSCPRRECKCPLTKCRGVYRLNTYCEGKGFSAMPLPLLDYTTESIDMRNNLIREIPAMKKFGLVHTLLLTGNPLVKVAPNAFHLFPRLEKLTFGGGAATPSNLTSLDASLLVSCKSLKSLTINYTSLKSLPERFFQQNDNLISLDLSNNAFTSLPARLFESLARIISITLAGNPLQLDASLCALHQVIRSRPDTHVTSPVDIHPAIGQASCQSESTTCFSPAHSGKQHLFCTCPPGQRYSGTQCADNATVSSPLSPVCQRTTYTDHCSCGKGERWTGQQCALSSLRCDASNARNTTSGGEFTLDTALKSTCLPGFTSYGEDYVCSDSSSATQGQWVGNQGCVACAMPSGGLSSISNITWSAGGVAQGWMTCRSAFKTQTAGSSVQVSCDATTRQWSSKCRDCSETVFGGQWSADGLHLQCAASRPKRKLIPKLDINNRVCNPYIGQWRQACHYNGRSGGCPPNTYKHYIVVAQQQSGERGYTVAEAAAICRWHGRYLLPAEACQSNYRLTELSKGVLAGQSFQFPTAEKGWISFNPSSPAQRQVRSAFQQIVICTDCQKVMAHANRMLPIMRSRGQMYAFWRCHNGYQFKDGGRYGHAYCDLTTHDWDKICIDMDECSTGVHNCPSNGQCQNTAGSYACHCPAGHTMHGGKCTDMDECASELHNCAANAVCRNTIGSHVCSCNPGYTGNGQACRDINECGTTLSNCAQHANCKNTPGSHTCTCNSGYYGFNGRWCYDVDECTVGVHNCAANAVCRNNIGSHVCTCKPGYTGNGQACTDINECGTALSNCSSNATCLNNIGSYSCSCRHGYLGDGHTCTEYQLHMCGSSCSEHASCKTTHGSHACTCNSGYYGDGRTCTAGCTVGVVANAMKNPWSGVQRRGVLILWSCKPGFRLKGTLFQSCTSSGWNVPQPTCTRVR